MNLYLADNLYQEEYQESEEDHQITVFSSAFILLILVYRNDKIYIISVLSNAWQTSKRLLCKRTIDVQYLPRSVKPIGIYLFSIRQKATSKAGVSPIGGKCALGRLPDRYNSYLLATILLHLKTKRRVCQKLLIVDKTCFK